jgi:hypothetical protein
LNEPPAFTKLYIAPRDAAATQFHAVGIGLNDRHLGEKPQRMQSMACRNALRHHSCDTKEEWLPAALILQWARFTPNM